MAKRETDERILEGALRALGRLGPRRLSLGEVCHEAHVSRATLFRYYRNKDELLTALAGHIEQDFSAVLTAAAERSAPADRIRAVLSAMIDFADSRPATRQLLSVEPGFALEFVEHELPTFTRAARKALASSLAEVPAVRARLMSEIELAELLIRVAISTFLVRSTRPQRLAVLMAALLDTDEALDPPRAALAGG
jgi:AcrR family transcriptional regulator